MVLFIWYKVVLTHDYIPGEAHRGGVGMSLGRCVVLNKMMDGFQTKTEFEERAAERLRADDGWISQLHRLATAHRAHSTTPQSWGEEIKSFGSNNHKHAEK